MFLIARQQETSVLVPTWLKSMLGFAVRFLACQIGSSGQEAPS